MTNIQHTPRPWTIWRLSPDSDPQERFIVTAADGETEICGVVANKADAFLIAAAPKMLEALRLCEDVLSELARLDDGTPSISALNMLRTAIADATGVVS
jgi:hypothetical protein